MCFKFLSVVPCLFTYGHEQQSITSLRSGILIVKTEFNYWKVKNTSRSHNRAQFLSAGAQSPSRDERSHFHDVSSRLPVVL